MKAVQALACLVFATLSSCAIGERAVGRHKQEESCAIRTKMTGNAPRFSLNNRGGIYGPLGESYKNLQLAYTRVKGARVNAKLRVYFMGSPDKRDSVTVKIRDSAGVEEEKRLVVLTEGGTTPAEERKFEVIEGTSLVKFGSDPRETIAWGWPKIPHYMEVNFNDFRCNGEMMWVSVEANFDEDLSNECIGVELIDIEFSGLDQEPQLKYGWNFVFSKVWQKFEFD